MQSSLKVTLTVGALSILLTLGLSQAGFFESPILRLPLGLLNVLSIGWFWSLLILKRAPFLELLTLSVILAISIPTFVVYAAVRLGATYSETTLAYTFLPLFAVPAFIILFRQHNTRKA